METVQDSRTEFEAETETLKKTQAERKVDLNHPITQPENSKEHVECIKQKIKYQGSKIK